MKNRISVIEVLKKELDGLKSIHNSYLFSSMKWPLGDHIKDFSDIDLRIVLDTFSEDEIIRVNETLVKIFTRLCSNQAYKRELEHPPGKIILLKELELGLTHSLDVNTWCFVHGNRSAFDRVIKKFRKTKPKTWEINSAIKLFKFRTKNFGNLSLEPNFRLLNKKQYLNYCLVWHYYVIKIFAFDCIISNKFPRGKSDSLKRIGQMFPVLKYCNRKKLLDEIYNKKTNPDELTKRLRKDLKSIDKIINSTVQNPINDFSQKMTEFASDLQFIRAQPCIWEVYININAAPQLIIREKYDLLKFGKSCVDFANAFKNKFPEEKKYFEIIQEFGSSMLKGADSSFSINTLKRLNNYFKLNLPKLQNAYLNIVNSQICPISIDSFKIKITPKCTRKCSFCIFSNNQLSEMTFEKFLKIIDKSRKFHFNKIFLNGGEPTLHTKFDQISNYLSQYFPSKEKILGTNCTIISKSQPIFNTLLKTYDTVLIGCDDEHKNFEDVEKVVPVMKSKGKKVIINTIHGYISDKNKQKLKNFCLSNDVIQVYNKLHIFCIGKKKHLDSICVRYKNKSLLVNIDGDCFRCYTGIDETSPEFNIFDKDFIKKLFTERNYHYKYCAYCDEYLPNKSSYNKRR